MSFSQKVASSGNVSGCKLTSSVKITLLLVMLDASGLSLWYYCCTIHSSYVGVLNTEWHSRILLLSPNVVRLGPALCDCSGVWKADSGTPLFDWETQLGACLSTPVISFHRIWFVSLYILQFFMILLRIHAIPCNISAIVTKANILVSWFKLQFVYMFLMFLQLQCMLHTICGIISTHRRLLEGRASALCLIFVI